MNVPIRFSEFDNIRVTDGGFEITAHFGGRTYTVVSLSTGMRDWQVEDGVWRQGFSATSKEAALLSALRIVQDRLAAIERGDV